LAGSALRSVLPLDVAESVLFACPSRKAFFRGRFEALSGAEASQFDDEHLARPPGVVIGEKAADRLGFGLAEEHPAERRVST